MIQPVSCYSDLEHYHQCEEQHVGYLEMVQDIVTFLRDAMCAAHSRVLEFGAGTGLPLPAEGYRKPARSWSF